LTPKGHDLNRDTKNLTLLARGLRNLTKKIIKNLLNCLKNIMANCTHSSQHESRLLVCAAVAQAAEYENKATRSNQNPRRLLDHSGLRKLLSAKTRRIN